jgi:hypothetical protein
VVGEEGRGKVLFSTWKYSYGTIYSKLEWVDYPPSKQLPFSCLLNSLLKAMFVVRSRGHTNWTPMWLSCLIIVQYCPLLFGLYDSSEISIRHVLKLLALSSMFLNTFSYFLLALYLILYNEFRPIFYFTDFFLNHI